MHHRNSVLRATFIVTTLGLVVSITATLLCFLFVRTELGYDGTIPAVDRTFRVNLKITPPGSEPVTLPSVPAETGAALKNLAGLEEVTRLSRENFSISIDGNTLQQEAYVVDDSFLHFFGLSLAQSTSPDALSAPGTAVISKDLAFVLFGAKQALGKTVQIGSTDLLKITGILNPTPRNLHFDPQLIVSNQSSFTRLGQELRGERPSTFNTHTYFKLKEGNDLSALEGEISDLPYTNTLMPAHQRDALNPLLIPMPVSQIHLNGLPAGELKPLGNMDLVMAIVVIGGLVFGISCLNITMMVRTDSDYRVREIGLRRAFGATKFEILTNFALRYSFLVGICTFISIVLTFSILPWVSAELGRSIDISLPFDLIALVGIPVAITLILIGGLAISTSGTLYHSPIAALQGELQRRGDWWKFATTSLQFAISIILISITIVIGAQITLAISDSLNIGDDDVLIIDGLAPPFPATAHSTLSELIKSIPSVKSVGLSAIVPTDFSTNLVGLFSAANGQTSPTGYASNSADQGFFETYGVVPLAGTTFVKNTGSNAANNLVVTKSAATGLGYSDPRQSVGQTIQMQAENGTVPFTILGVVPDVPMKSIESSPERLVFTELSDRARYLSVRYDANDRTSVEAAVTSAWEKFSAKPIKLSSLRDRLNVLYEPLEQTFRFFMGLTGVALVLTGLGMFATASYTAERRVKEMGLRRALGASQLDVANELIWGMSRPFIFAIFLAVPLALLISQQWLSKFAQHISLTAVPFVYATSLAAIVGLLSVGFQAYKISVAKPAETLRRER